MMQRKRSLMIGATALLLSLSLALGGCGSRPAPAPATSPAAPAPAPPALSIEGVWARPAKERPDMGATSAAYMVITNTGEQDDALIAAVTDVAEVVELHEMAMVDNVMRMQMVESIPVPAGQSVELKPGGLHVMLIGLDRDLQPGDTFALRLVFAKTGDVDLTVTVQEMPAGMGQGMQSGGMGQGMHSGSMGQGMHGGGMGQEGAAAQAGNLKVAGIWARPAKERPDMGATSAAYMVITNSGERDDALIAAASDAAEVVELHEMAMVDNVMRMQMVESIPIPAGQSVELKPGGLHVMLIGLTRDLQPDDTFMLELHFAGGARLQFPVTVQQQH